MKWLKRGLIYGPPGDSWWAQRWALQPTPWLRDNGTIRVFCGFRTKEGVSRVGYVDVNADNPSEVLGVSKEPVLDIGAPGAFDENGVVPCVISEREGKLYLYYAGYMLGQKVKFLAFGGLAISEDGGESFKRYSRAPITDRTDDAFCFRAIHCLMNDDGVWRAWYGGGSHYTTTGDGRQLPNYNIRHAISDDGIHLRPDFAVCLDTQGEEYRVGRPHVIKRDGIYRMLFCAGTPTERYRLAYAESPDGIAWTRKDDAISLVGPQEVWDSEMQAYPCTVMYRDKVYLLYNGNNYGEDGFGYAVLEHW